MSGYCPRNGVLQRTTKCVEAVGCSAVMLFGGKPVGERFLYRSFVSPSQDRLAQPAADWKAGGMKLSDADDAGFIPVPDHPAQRAPASL